MCNLHINGGKNMNKQNKIARWGMKQDFLLYMGCVFSLGYSSHNCFQFAFYKYYRISSYLELKCTIPFFKLSIFHFYLNQNLKIQITLH